MLLLGVMVVVVAWGCVCVKESIKWIESHVAYLGQEKVKFYRTWPLELENVLQEILSSMNLVNLVT